MLNDMSLNGNIDASLSLFNLYLQGAEDMGIDRDPRMAQRYLNQINDYINQNGLQNLNPQYVYNLGYAELYNQT